MNKKKMMLLILLFLLMAVGIRKLDLRLRYNMSLAEYYTYHTALSSSEQGQLKEKPLLVGVYNDPPLSFTNEYNNDNAGIMVDYLSQLAIELSNNIHLKAASKEQLLTALQGGEIDIIAIEKQQADYEYLAYSQPLCVVKGKIAVPANSTIENLRDLEGQTLVALEGDVANGLIHKYLKGKVKVNITLVDNMYQCFALVRNDLAVGFIGDDMEVAHYMNVTNRANGYKYLESELYQKEICLAVKKENESLLTIVNKGILELKKKNLIVQTQKKWLGDFDSHGMDVRQLELAYKIVLSIVIIIAGFSSWNYVITQRVNTKTRELSESKAELRLIIDTLQRGIMVIENDAIIVECNDAITNLLKVAREDLIGKDYHEIDVLTPFLKKEHMDQVFTQGHAYYYITCQIYENNKRLIMIEDYTEKHITERRVRQESKMIAVGQLSAGLAHEIRNPLGLIKSYVYVLEKYASNDISKHAISVINDSVGRVNNLIENLLRFSKLSNDESKVVEVQNLVDLILSLEAKNLEENDIQVTIRVRGDHIRPVIINEDVVKMILLNLINNAIDSFADLDRLKKKIHLDLEISQTELTITIIDNGCGIGKDQLENIFNPFYSTKDSGTGLGLYLIGTEIANNDGKISVDSKFGEGTEFKIVLPIKG